jgi:exopolysaccharide biosynthesis polyprenyl glycosylphosphotransferase
MNRAATPAIASRPAPHRSPPKEFARPFFKANNRARSHSARVRMGRLRQGTYVAIDVAIVWATGLAALRLPQDISFEAQHGHAREHWAFLILYSALIVLACASQSLYRTSRERAAMEESFAVAKAVGLATALVMAFVFASGTKEVSRSMALESGGLNVIALAGWRYAKRVCILRRARNGRGLSTVLIVGAGDSGRALAEWLGANRQLGYAVCGFLDRHTNGDPRVLGKLSDLRRVALGHFVDEVFVTLPAERDLVKEVFAEARRLRLEMHVVPDLYDGLAWHAPLHQLGGFPILQLHGQPIPLAGLAVKRAVDIAISALVLLLSVPVLAVAAFLIRMDSRGPILYCAPRVGRKGRKFRCYKLRSMVQEADNTKEKLRSLNERRGPFFKVGNDPRVTRCGSWLRRFSLDELPQMVNVILGDMSLVGPRPHPVDDVERYHPEDLRRLDVKPGITGLWQVTARRDPSFDRNMSLDLEYIENWSLGLDLKILLKTIPEVLRGAGK